jgi:regulatory protein
MDNDRQCYDYFLWLLSRQEYTAKTLQHKGLAKGYSQVEIAEAIAQLQEQGYQSDRRCAEGLVASYQQKYGRAMIWRKCWNRGIDRELFEQVWAEQSTGGDDRYCELREKVQRRYKVERFDRLDPKTKAKVINFLQYRGFNPWRVLEIWQRE